MKTTLVTAILFAFTMLTSCAPARADNYFMVDAGTYHSGNCGGEPCKQPLKLGWQRSNLFEETLGNALTSDVSCGTNSYGTLSCSLAAKLEPLSMGNFKAGGFAGIASGYNHQQNRIAPLVAGLSMTYTQNDFTAQLLLVPEAGHGTQNVLDFWIGWRIKFLQ